MKKSIMTVCMMVAGLACIGLFSQGCGGGDGSSAPAASSGEIILSSQNGVAMTASTALTIPAVLAPTSGVVTVTVNWTGGGLAVVGLRKNGAAAAAAIEGSPVALSAGSVAGDSWSAVITPYSNVTANIVLSLVP